MMSLHGTESVWLSPTAVKKWSSSLFFPLWKLNLDNLKMDPAFEVHPPLVSLEMKRLRLVTSLHWSGVPPDYLVILIVSSLASFQPGTAVWKRGFNPPMEARSRMGLSRGRCFKLDGFIRKYTLWGLPLQRPSHTSEPRDLCLLILPLGAMNHPTLPPFPHSLLSAVEYVAVAMCSEVMKKRSRVGSRQCLITEPCR